MSHRTTAIHPGEVLLEVYMKPSCPELTAETLAQTLRVPPQVIISLINGRMAITPSMAMQLAVICRTTPEYWLGLQRTYDVQTGRKTGTRERRGKIAQTGHPAAA